MSVQKCSRHSSDLIDDFARTSTSRDRIKRSPIMNHFTDRHIEAACSTMRPRHMPKSRFDPDGFGKPIRTSHDPQGDRRAAQTALREAEPSSASHTPALSTSYSLIVVMIVFVLFGAAGFFAAAQIPLAARFRRSRRGPFSSRLRRLLPLASTGQIAALSPRSPRRLISISIPGRAKCATVINALAG